MSSARKLLTTYNKLRKDYNKVLGEVLTGRSHPEFRQKFEEWLVPARRIKGTSLNMSILEAEAAIKRLKENEEKTKVRLTSKTSYLL